MNMKFRSLPLLAALFFSASLAPAQLHVVASGNSAAKASSASVSNPDSFAKPDVSLTPGDVLSNDKKAVCTPGYTRTVRNVSLKTKQQVMVLYHKKDSMSNYEIDHLIPLELGGSNSIKNLWPQPLAEAHLKDGLENRLHRKVCKNEDFMLLKDAQQAIAKDWVQFYKSYVVPQEGQH